MPDAHNARCQCGDPTAPGIHRRPGAPVEGCSGPIRDDEPVTPEEVIEAVMREHYDHLPLKDVADMVVRSLHGFGYSVTRDA